MSALSSARLSVTWVRPERAKAHCGDSFVKCRENLRLTDRCRDAVPVHVGSQVWIDTREDHVDPLAVQIIEQIAYGLRGGIIDIRDRARIDNEPPHRRRRALHEAHALRRRSGYRSRKTDPRRTDRPPARLGLRCPASRAPAPTGRSHSARAPSCAGDSCDGHA